MAWYHEIASAARSLAGKRREDREMAEEMRFHIDMETRRNVAAGLPEAEAHAIAVRQFGGVERHKDDTRDERGTGLLDDVASDLRFAARSLARRPAFASLAILTLGLGIGATTTLFGVVKQVLLTPLPYDKPDQVVEVWSAWKGFDRTWLSYDEWEGWKARIPAFADIGLYSDYYATFDGSTPERVHVAQIQANVLPILGARPLVGRNFTAEEDRPNARKVVILGGTLWQRRFGADPAIVGRDVQVGGTAYTVVGVMPADFRLPLDFGASGRTEAWFPLATDAKQSAGVPGPEFPKGGASHGYDAVARLASGATPDVANAQLRSMVAELEKFGYMANVNFHAFVIPVREQIVGGVRTVLLVVFGAVVFVMLIACANVAGLLLVRGEGRSRELAVRVALGAGSRRLVRLLLAESSVLAIAGAALGVGLSLAAVQLLRANAPAGLPRVADTRIDWAVLAFALVAGVVAALAAGILPAVHARAVAPAGALREGSRGATASRARLRWRQSLVMTEVALAVILVVGAGLMIRSVRNLLSIDAGFRPENVLTMQISTPTTWYQDSMRVIAFWDDLQRRVSSLPGVKRVGAVRNLPLATEMGDWGMLVEGYAPAANRGFQSGGKTYVPGDWQIVTPGYFEAMGLKLLQGRVFDSRDGYDAPLSLVVNHTFAETYLKGRNPIGARVQIGGQDSTTWYSIVGVTEDVHHNTLTITPKPEFYATLAQFARAPGNTRRSMTLVVRTTNDPSSVAGPIRAIVRDLDPRLPVSNVKTMGEVVNNAIAGQRFAMQSLGVFGVLALVLSAIGIFGIVSQVVTSRSHEFGIRAALGATPRELVALSLSIGMRQIAIGLAVGVGIALVLTRAMTSMLQGVRPADPLTFGAVIVVIAVMAALASLGPARRAGKVDPARVLSS